MNRIKIALWKPTHQLIRNSEKLDSKLYCISKIFTDEIQQNEDNSKWKVFTEKDLDTFDVMLIEFENHQITRKNYLRSMQLEIGYLHLKSIGSWIAKIRLPDVIMNIGINCIMLKYILLRQKQY